MKTIKLKDYTVVTDLDEQKTFNNCLAIEGIGKDDEKAIEEQLARELDIHITPVIEEMIVGGKSAADFFFAHSRGYKDRRLEPFNWRETKKKVTICYTGTQGGGKWFADILRLV